MNKRLRCGNGHQWEVNLDDHPGHCLAADLCPTCGSGAETMPPPGEVQADTVDRKPRDPSAAPALPEVPGYEILGVLGKGGMGVVYKARHLQLGRLVALKMILAGSHAGMDELARFRDEAESVARMQHANIVQIYEVGEQDGLPFFSMEFVVGGGGAGLWYHNYQLNRRIRQEYVNKEVRQALDDAEDKREALHRRLINPKKVHELLSDIGRWRALLDEAKGALRRAQSVAQASRELLSEELAAKLGELEQRLAADDKGWAVAKVLDDIRLEAGTLVEGKFEPSRAAKKYPGAFARAGLDVEHLAPAEVATRMASSPVRYALVTALDHWTFVDTESKLQLRLLEVARKADPQPWRKGFRDVKVWNDRMKLERLAKELQAEEQSPQVMLNLAWRLKANGGNPTALLRRALLDHPRDFWLYFDLGRFAKDPVEKVGFYQAALALRPKSGPAHNNLGIALHDKKDVEGAIQEYHRAIKLHPNDALAHNNLGIALRDKKDLAEAIAHYRKAIQIDPNSAPAHYNLGLTLFDKGQFTEARKATLQLLKLLPTNHPRRQLAQRRLQQCDYGLVLDRKLATFLTNGKKPKEINEQLELAFVCHQY